MYESFLVNLDFPGDVTVANSPLGESHFKVSNFSPAKLDPNLILLRQTAARVCTIALRLLKAKCARNMSFTMYFQKWMPFDTHEYRTVSVQIEEN